MMRRVRERVKGRHRAATVKPRGCFEMSAVLASTRRSTSAPTGQSRSGAPEPSLVIPEKRVQPSLDKSHLPLPAQLRITVMGEMGPSTTVFIKNRPPSGETMYCCLFTLTAPPTWVVNNPTGTRAPTV
jgi:hypothetical protein